MQNIENIKALFATLANCERISDDKEPGSLSLADIQSIGTAGLDAIDEIDANAA